MFTLEIKENEITVPNISLLSCIVKMSELSIIRCTIIMNLYYRNYFIIWFMCMCVCAMCVWQCVCCLLSVCLMVPRQVCISLYALVRPPSEDAQPNVQQSGSN